VATINDQITKLYIATFNRAPDAAGLTYWAGKITTDGWNIETVAASMFDQIETQTKYPSTLNTNDFIDAVYLNILNRAADTAGKSYWSDELTSGNVTKNNFIIAMINGAESGGSENDKALLENKRAVGIHFAVDQVIDDSALALDVMQYVTSDAVSKTKALATIDAYINVQGDLYLKTLGGSGDDTINADTHTDWIEGFGGNDTIYAGSGQNWVSGGDDDDRIYGYDKIDTLLGGSGDDTIYGGDDDDLLFGEAGDDSIHGDSGNDQLFGEAGSDYLYGDSGDDTLQGGDDADNLYGGAGNDTLYGGDGNDVILGEAGNNWIDGGAGNDLIYGDVGIDTIYGGVGNDTIYGDSGADVLDGMSGDDTMYGSDGDDTVNGNSGNDTLYGGDGNDLLSGEDGTDVIYGGMGSDTLFGGVGIDIFAFASGDNTRTDLDTVMDYGISGSNDLIRLHDRGTEVISNTNVNVTAATSLAEAADAASTGDGSTNGIIKWFQYLDNTYIIEDLDAAATFTDGTDIIVKIQGLHDFSSLSSYILFA